MVGAIVIVLIVLCVAFLVVSEKVFERTNYYKKNFGETEKLKERNNVDYINTGSTFAYYGIDYNSAGVQGLNLALCPQSLEYDFKMLRQYKNRYNPGATVFIVVSDLAFLKKKYTETGTVEKYYKVLDRKEIEHYDPIRCLRAKYFPVLYSWKNFLRFCKDIKAYNESEICVNENDREAVEADAFNMCRSWMKEFGLHDLQDSDQCSAFTDEVSFTTGIVKDMISWCRKEGFRPILVALPVTAEMSDSFSRDFLDSFYYEYMRKIENDMNIRFIDLSKDDRLADYLLYLDSCRLNAVGRMIITKRLIAEAEGKNT